MNNCKARSVLLWTYNSRITGEPKWKSLSFSFDVLYLKQHFEGESIELLFTHFFNAFMTLSISWSLLADMIAFRRSSVKILAVGCSTDSAKRFLNASFRTKLYLLSCWNDDNYNFLPIEGAYRAACCSRDSLKPSIPTPALEKILRTCIGSNVRRFPLAESTAINRKILCIACWKVSSSRKQIGKMKPLKIVMSFFQLSNCA